MNTEVEQNKGEDDATPSTSESRRDRTLTKHMKRYWKLNTDPKNYYEDKNKLTTQQKLRRMNREKKLKKFFGDTPEMDYVQTDFATIERRARLDSQGSILSLQQTEEQSDIYAKKKKVEKLEGFFGGKLPNQQLQEQNLVTDVPEPVPLNEQEEPNMDNELPPTINVLSNEERKILQKKSQKLKDILGEPANPNVSNTLVRRKSNYAKSKALFEYLSSAEFTMSNQSVPEIRKSLRLDDENVIILDPSPLMKKRNSNMEARAESSDDIEGMLQDQTPAEVLRKEQRRRKLSKLQTFLGERLNVKAQKSQNLIPESRPLTSQQKKQQQRKVYKLEKVFGEMPPQEMIIQDEDSWKVKQEKSIHALSYLLDHESSDEIKDLVKAMVDFEEKEQQAKEQENKEQVAQHKVQRQKKLNKLSHFFGNVMNEEILMEQKILSEIQQALADDIASDDELKSSALATEVQELKTKISKRAKKSRKGSKNTNQSNSGPSSP